MSYLEEVERRARHATPGIKEVHRLSGFHTENFRYEISEGEGPDNEKNKCLVSFYEENHEPIMRAKFNADLFAHAAFDILELVRRLRVAENALDKIASTGYPSRFNSKKGNGEMLDEIVDLSKEALVAIRKDPP